MGKLLISPEKDAWKHVKERVRSLFVFDEVRVMKLLESLQFGLGYLVIGFFLGTLIDWSFPSFDEDKPTSEVFLEVLFQSLVLIVMVFYLRKIVKIMPFMFVLNFDLNRNGVVRKYKPYEESEYSGEVMIALAVLGTQFSLIKKFDLLSSRLYNWFYMEERKVEASI